MRLSIDMSESQYQQIEALAASRGLSITEYILEKALPMTEDEREAMDHLKALLAPRLDAIKRGEFYPGTMDDLLREIHAEDDGQN